MLCFVVLNVAVAKAAKKESNNYYGIAICFVVVAAGIVGGQVSGSCLNPEVVLGLNFMSPSWQSLFIPIYIVVELLGGFFATTFFHIVRPEERVDESSSQYQELGALTKFAFKVEGMFDPEDTAEFLGTFFLCFTISLSALVVGQAKNGGVWSIAACLMCLIYAMGDISGGLFNPALTLAFTGRFYGTGLGLEGENNYSQKLADICLSDENGRSAKKEPLKYLLAQLLGGAAGSGTTMLVYLFAMSTGKYGSWPAAEVKTGNTTMWVDGSSGSGKTAIHGSTQYTLAQAFFAEAFGTFILCFVVLAVASRKNALKEYTPFCIGGCIVGAGYSFGPLSGAILNPAVALANSLCYKLSLIYTAEPFCYMLAELTGGALAAIVFKYLIYSNEYDKDELTSALRENE
jgi:glycerol uptake facilitator-like aquaporin